MVFAHYMPSTPPLAFHPQNTYWYRVPYDTKSDNLLTRPILTPRLGSSDIDLAAYRDEIRLAKSYGIDGFFVDFLEDENSYRLAWTCLIKAAELEGAFKIGLMPDAATLDGDYINGGNQKYGSKREKIRRWLDIAGDSSALLRHDGKPAIVEYGNGYPDAKGTIPQVKAQFLDWMSAQGKPVAYGAVLGADWPLYKGEMARDSENGYPSQAFVMGTFTPGMMTTELFERHLNYFPANIPKMAENRVMYYNHKWFYTGDRGTHTYRKFWDFAIKNRDRAPWMQLLTWNDLGESAIAPTVHHFQAFAPLTRYYATWYKTGIEPKIEHDWLALFHRQHPYRAEPTEIKKRVSGDNVTIPADEVEALTFLSEPATLVVKTGEKTTRHNLNAGIHAVYIPFELGTQSAQIERAGKTVAHVTTPIPIHDRPVRENLWLVAADSAHPPRELQSQFASENGLSLIGREFELGNTVVAATFTPNQTARGVVARLTSAGDYRFMARHENDEIKWQLVRKSAESFTVLDEGTAPVQARIRLRLDSIGEHLIAFIDEKLVSSNTYDFNFPHGRAGVLGETKDYDSPQVLTLDPAHLEK